MTDGTTDYLAEYDAAAEGDKYPLVQGWMRTEPLAFFKQLRDRRPVLVTPVCTLVAKFTDVRDMLQMPKIFTVDLYKPKMAVTGPDDGYLMAHDDDALHYREKSLMQGLLNRNDLPRVREMVATSAKEILGPGGGEHRAGQPILPHGAGAPRAGLFRPRRHQPGRTDPLVVLEPIRCLQQPTLRYAVRRGAEPNFRFAR
jgi:hypothetical protein